MQLRAVTLISALSFCACDASPSPTTDHSAASERAVIAGFDAKSPSLNAIGTVGRYDADLGIYSYWCTATLITPTLVLTAKHCAMSTTLATFGEKLTSLMPVHFAVGPDSAHPTKLYEIVAAELSSVNEGGFIKLGNDVAVLTLKEAVEGVTPIAVAQTAFAASDVGRSFVSVGFGSKNLEEAAYQGYSGKRFAGGVTIHATGGQSYAALYGTWANYYGFMVWLYGQDTVDIAIEIITGWWNNVVILPDYELHAGGQPGDAQLCFGDDGAPLIGQEGGTRKLFGVASNSWFSPRAVCDSGTFFATIGPKTREMIDAASQPGLASPAVTPTAATLTAADIRNQIEAYRAQLQRHSIR